MINYLNLDKWQFHNFGFQVSIPNLDKDFSTDFGISSTHITHSNSLLQNWRLGSGGNLTNDFALCVLL
jgi:hypothetical protein